MLSRCRWCPAAVLAAIALFSASLWAAKDFIPPRADNANTYASKDAHPTEKVTAALDVYNTAPKDQIFITPYSQEGILPVLLIVSNDGDQPITVNNMHAELVTASRAKLDALEVDDVFRRVGHIRESGAGDPKLGPIPLSGNKNKKAQKEYEEILAARFAAEAVEPHTTRSGFLFFDIADVKQPVAGAHLYLTGLRDAGGNELLYFDIAVAPSNAAAGPQ